MQDSSSVLPPVEEKPRYVARMFGRIARRYDLMNSLISAGMDAGWREVVADVAPLQSGSCVLDIGTGTGKLAQALARRLGSGLVVGADFTLPMLLAGAPALARDSDGRRVRLAAADALRLPFADAQFDTVTSGFLVRNLADLAGGIREQARVLKPGGTLLTLETTPGPPGALRPLFGLYFRRIVPILGGLIAGDFTAYTYLPESTAAFAEPERVADEFTAAGLIDVRQRRLALGTVAVTWGRKPP